MSCARVRQVLDALVDRELDAATEREIETHLAGCPDCARMKAERAALSGQLRAGAPYFGAPDRLRDAIGNSLPGGARALPEVRPVRPVRPGAGPTWIQAGLLAASASAASLALGIWLGRPPIDDARRGAMRPSRAMLRRSRRDAG